MADPVIDAVARVLREMTYPEHVTVTARKVLDAIEGSHAALVVRCTCAGGPDADTPDEDCPVHGLTYRDLWAHASRAASARTLMVHEQRSTAPLLVAAAAFVAAHDGTMEQGRAMLDLLKPHEAGLTFEEVWVQFTDAWAQVLEQGS